MKFELEPYNRNVPDDELIEDVRAVARQLSKKTLTVALYNEYGKYNSSTLQKRFRSWFKVLELAGLEPSRAKPNDSDDLLFDNIRNIWMALARQPKYSEIKKPLSAYSAKVYENKFGSWRKALEEFVAWVARSTSDEIEQAPDINQMYKETAAAVGKPIRRTRREVSEGLRFRILMRDGFRCLSCGASPLITPGLDLEADHIIPWSKGGETVPENLQTKCKRCNAGKGNRFDK